MQTGSEIVATMAGGRDWWRLRAGDVSRWVSTLHPSATQELSSRIEWIGDPWDGESDVAVGGGTVTGAKAKRLVAELGRAIRRLKLPDVALPDAGSVRLCRCGSGDRPELVIDVDLGDFILPLAVDDRLLRRDPAPCRAIASRMAEHVRMADRKRSVMAARAERLRRAAEETAAAIGEGVAPLWLRLDAVAYHDDPRDLAFQRYVMLLVTLNHCLRWSPVGTERIETVRDVRGHRAWYAKTQRPRAAALAALRASGSEGPVSEVALAMIQERGLDPATVFRQAIDARLADQRGCVEFERNGHFERLYHVDGTLHATFGFKGGHYYMGQLTLWGDWPEQLAIGARKRRLADYVDHPALASTGVTVTKATIRAGAFDLDHDVRLIPVEAAGRTAEARAMALAA